jgi:arsenate reductase
MAEGLWRDLAGSAWEVSSAGSRPAGFVHPLAVEVMAELGIDIASQRSKPLTEFNGQPIDLVITVCDNANRDCPVFPDAVKRLHWPFDDPAGIEGAPDEVRAAFRRVRDEIRERIASWLRAAGASDAAGGGQGGGPREQRL